MIETIPAAQTVLGHTRIDSWIRYLPKTEGTVTATYHRSFDVKVMDFLLNFHTSEDSAHPLSIYIASEFHKFVEKNRKVQISFPDFSFGGTTIHTEPKFFSPGEKVLEGPSLRENCARILSALKLFGRCSEVSGAYIKRAENRFLKPIFLLLFHLKKDRRVNLDEYMSMFGGGEGLTPGWDDFCTGLLLCDRQLKNSAVIVGKNFFNDIRQRTTLHSFWQLRFAEVGKSSLLYERFLSKLSVTKLSATDIVKCVNYGHSSGTDILAGIHAYLANYLAG